MPAVTQREEDLAAPKHAEKSPAVYLTRSDISWYTPNANAYQKPLVLARVFDLTLVCPDGLRVPEEIACSCRIRTVKCGDVSTRWTILQCFRFMVASCRTIIAMHRDALRASHHICVATGFDIPCLVLGWWTKRVLGRRWLVFCWDPPALSWRDRNDFSGRLVVKAVNLIFRQTVRFADRLVLNIHPHILKEIGYPPAEAQLIQMLNGYETSPVQQREVDPAIDPWLVGVLSRATVTKGFDLVMEAFVKLAVDNPKLRLMWIGEIGQDVGAAVFERLKRVGICPKRLVFTGKVAHQDALRRLQECGVLLYPYLAVPSLQWNYPLKLAEYMSLGRAIVAADLPGARTYIENGSNGLLFRAGDLDALMKTLGKIAGDESAQFRLANQAKRDAENIQWPKLNQELIEKIREG